MSKTSQSLSTAEISRRHWLQLSLAGAFGISASRWFPAFADEAAANPQRSRSCILLWMNGGPSQLDTFDLKPGQPTGGTFKPIDTAVPGIRISEHLPKLAKLADHLAIIRSMTTAEGDHSRAAYAIRTGYKQQPPIQYPAIGSLVGKELGSTAAELPSYVSVAPFTALSPAAYSPGFLGPKFAPLIVGAQNSINNGTTFNPAELQVRNLQTPMTVSAPQAQSRLELLGGLNEEFQTSRPGIPTSSHRSAYEQAVRMMHSTAAKAFRLEDEPAELRGRYGENVFGQGCLLARRLVEQRVPFVEVSLNGVPGLNGLGWDTHQKNFENVQKLSEVLDPAWSTLIADLKDRGLLDSTLIVWMGEFGRTPVINQQGGRDHFPKAWSTVLAGGGIRGAQTIGTTDATGQGVSDRPVSSADLMATICQALGLDPRRQNVSNIGRPIRLADPDGKPIKEALL